MQAAGKGRVRAKELEKQIEEMRTMYTRRIRALETRLASEASRRTSTSSDSQPGAVGMRRSSDAAAGTGADKQDKDDAKAARVGTGRQTSGSRMLTINAAKLRQKDKEIIALKQQLEEQREQVRNHSSTSAHHAAKGLVGLM